jgi:serine/threonine-protein kinase
MQPSSARETKGVRPGTVGRYALFEAIASGGMATVHLGRLMGPVGFSRTVAIKRLHQNFSADPEFVTMFLDEARLAARIRHPNVVPTLDVVAENGEVLLVMEYIAGATLSALLRAGGQGAGAVALPIIVDTVVSMLHGLHAAHEATNERGEPLHIVHRDVSPQNVLVGVDGVARVLDFGVAKAMGQSHQTRAGQIKGKLRYMPPEQLRGGDIDRRVDIYAAGVVLWKAITGRRLVNGGNDGEVIYQIMEGVAARPSTHRPEVPARLDEIVLRALSKDPARRFETARAMALALEGTIEPVTRSTVASWVLQCAGDDIRHRSEQVLAIERAPPSVDSVAVASSAPPNERASHASVSNVRPSAVADTPATHEAPPAQRKYALLAATLMLLAGVGGWALVTWGMPLPSEGTETVRSAPAKEPTVTAPSVAPPAPLSGVALPIPSAAAGLSAPPASASAPPAAKSARPARVASGKAPATVKPVAKKSEPRERMYRRD